MNRYAAAGIIADAKDGKHVVVLSINGRDSRCAFAEVAHHAKDADRVHRANGAERIDFTGGGQITFHRGVDSLRGTSADIIYLNGDAERHIHNTDQWSAVQAAIATASTPQIIRA